MFWITVFILTFIIEIISLSLVSIWFSAGALVAIVLDIIGVLMTGQIVGFIVTSLLTFFIFRPVLIKHVKSPKVRTNMDRYIGKTGRVIKEIGPLSFGQVNINGQIWTGKSKDGVYIKEGTIIEVVDIEGVKLIVVESERGNVQCHGSF
ncbi:NfeD family protein [Wansuia hejianensis]|uniref:NfeD family protein n=1 Tax=Wansuia hejianensis TaxID=2763667 RepID=A0A926IL06_9FIRM|nr:NfeD family protein [Wansuia hejianensis]MBC8589634.1 NfeD family protein [Wansuia hejianensis]